MGPWGVGAPAVWMPPTRPGPNALRALQVCDSQGMCDHTPRPPSEDKEDKKGPERMLSLHTSPIRQPNRQQSKQCVQTLLGFVIAIVSSVAFADWQLDNDTSQLSFVSVKATDVVEVHKFNQLSGTIREAEKHSGDLDLSVHLASVNTLIPLRDSRMRELLFEIATFPVAKLAGQLPLAELATVAVGDSSVAELTLTLDLHGEKAPVTASVLVSRLSQDRVMVTSQQPVVLQAQTFNLVKGIDALREVAGLPSIAKAIPVSFVFTFVKAT